MNIPSPLSFGTLKITNPRFFTDDKQEQLINDLSDNSPIDSLKRGEFIMESMCPMADQQLAQRFNRYRAQINDGDCVLSKYYLSAFLTAKPDTEEKVATFLEKKGYGINRLG